MVYNMQRRMGRNYCPRYYRICLQPEHQSITLPHLKATLGSYQFPDTEAILHVIKIIFNKLALLHEDGMLHRDLKPENIMVQDEGFLNAYLIDFGASVVTLNPHKKYSLSNTETTYIFLHPALADPDLPGHVVPMDGLIDLFSLVVIWAYLIKHPLYDRLSSDVVSLQDVQPFWERAENQVDALVEETTQLTSLSSEHQSYWYNLLKYCLAPEFKWDIPFLSTYGYKWCSTSMYSKQTVVRMREPHVSQPRAPMYHNRGKIMNFFVKYSFGMGLSTSHVARAFYLYDTVGMESCSFNTTRFDNGVMFYCCFMVCSTLFGSSLCPDDLYEAFIHEWCQTTARFAKKYIENVMCQICNYCHYHFYPTCVFDHFEEPDPEKRRLYMQVELELLLNKCVPYLNIVDRRRLVDKVYQDALVRNEPKLKIVL